MRVRYLSYFSGAPFFIPLVVWFCKVENCGDDGAVLVARSAVLQEYMVLVRNCRNCFARVCMHYECVYQYDCIDFLIEI